MPDHAPLRCFKAYDIRGRVPDELNTDIAYRIGRAFVELLDGRTVVVGRDVRLSSAELAEAVRRGINDAGFDVIDIGVGGTEEMYFQTAHRNAAGGVMVTASHNPMDYNGMKLVRAAARPISADSGLQEIRAHAEQGGFASSSRQGATRNDADKSAFIRHLLSYIDRSSLKPLKIVVNAGNGGAGQIVDLLAPHLPFDFVRVHHQPDGRFPNGIPNPLLIENRAATAAAVRAHRADLGIAWDGDFDRCFFFDADGRFIEGYYLVGLLAVAALKRHPGSKIVLDPRLTWNTLEMVRAARGVPVISKSGHAFIKERMRAEDAVYGGEMSAHHYFRDFAYCDSGMIPWLLVAALLSQSGRTLAELVDDRMRAFPCSGEINFRVADAGAANAAVLAHYVPMNPVIDRTDGISLEFEQWRFNLRSSNTEPLLRLNVETRADPALLQERTEEIAGLIRAC